MFSSQPTRFPLTDRPVTHGHGVSPADARQEYARRLLIEVETGNGTSQRTLARRAGMALGLTNLILKTLVQSGWVRVAHVEGRVRYVITPEGVAEKTRISTAYLAYQTRVYAEARNRVRDRLAALSREWTADGAGPKRIAFYGAAEVGEIGYVCLQETDLVVTAVFDGTGRPPFFGTPVRPLDRLASPESWADFDVLVIMSFEDRIRREAEARLSSAGFPPERVFWM
jgi:predicted transcriptional regulator